MARVRQSIFFAAARVLASSALLSSVALAVGRGDALAPQPAIPLLMYDIKPMPDPYRILLSRSIFARDNRSAAVSRATVASSETRPASTEPSPAAYVLKGVAVEDKTPIAFFEQSAEQALLRVHPGESVWHGKVVAISLDGVDYLAGGKSSHILIGQSLDGGEVSLPATRPSRSSELSERPSWWRKSR